ncbi:MAG: TlpA family protein disulfide reductase [Deltaproteobacteria bacterium]|nr:TlpA family protein disulfide reductase [Deltaproteobacteria bacterium]
MLLLALAGCVPHLYTEDTGSEPWSWEAPENDWPMGEPPYGLVGSGFDEGEVVPDFRLLDQRGQTVSLWQFYGQVILLDLSTMWCSPCQDLAAHTEESWEAYRDQGFVYLTVLAEDIQGQDPEVDDLVFWADNFGISAPVLGDPGKRWSSLLGANLDYPRVWVVGRDLSVVEVLPPAPTDAMVVAAIEGHLGD